MSGCDEEVKEEVEALEAILMEGVNVETDENGRPSKLSLKLTPQTAENGEEKKYVSLNLILNLPWDYPQKSPLFSIGNPRGLDQESLDGLMGNLSKKCCDYSGHPVLYDLVECTQEFLTVHNVPSCPCVVCLNPILETDTFVKTECFHYFHSICYGRYVQSEILSHRQHVTSHPIIPGASQDHHIWALKCPVCRELISKDMESMDVSSLLQSPIPSAEKEEASFRVTPELKALQSRMKTLYLKQQDKGAIIDVEAEEKKFLVMTRSESNESQGEAASAAEQPSPPVQPPPPCAKQKKKKKEKEEEETEDGYERRRRNKNYHNHNTSRHQRHKKLQQQL